MCDDLLGYFHFDWSESKVHAQKYMSFFSEAKDWRLDFFLALACYLVTGGGQRAVGPHEDYKKKFVFPFLATLKKSGAANVVTQFLNKIQLSGNVEGMSPSTTGTGLRIGPTNDLAANPFVTISQIIQRGGWEFRGICNVFEVSYAMKISKQH